MDEATAKRKYQELQLLQEHMQRLSDQLQSLEQKTVEIDTIKQALEDLKDVKEGSEIQVPLANGLFVKAHIDKTDKLLINVGANTVVEKTREEALELVDKQGKELDKFKQQIMQQMSQVDEQAYMIEQEVIQSQQR
jgi:prefoldin alpha subunit